MPLDPYSTCPCGSGKKFKWCCAPYFPTVEKAFEQENEGEMIGALLLYRKAAEAYDLEAHEQLASTYIKIYQGESMLNRPVAARAALERAAHFVPADAELRAQLDGEFGEDGPYPAAA